MWFAQVKAMGGIPVGDFQAMTVALYSVAQEMGVLIVEDAPYVYISYASQEERPKPFFAMDPAQTVHLLTGSKIGFPGPRVGFFYSEATLSITGGKEVSLTEMALSESSSDVLFQNPGALRGFEDSMAGFGPYPARPRRRMRRGWSNIDQQLRLAAAQHDKTLVEELATPRIMPIIAEAWQGNVPTIDIDEEAYGRYAALAGPAIAKHGGSFIARGGSDVC